MASDAPITTDQDQKDETPRRRPLGARLAPRAGEPADMVRLYLRVPPLVQKVLEATGRSAEREVLRTVGELWRKLTPERGPNEKSTYAGEVLYFERLLAAPPETLTHAERLFVHAQRAHEELSALAEAEDVDDEVRREASAVVESLIDPIFNAQELVRRERGEAAPQADWEATQP